MELAMEPEKGQLNKESKKEIEQKIGQILKLIRNNGPDKKGKLPPADDPKKKSELVSLVEDVHKQYQSLYSKYANLRGVTAKKARVRKKKTGSGSTSTSDSEYYSPMEAPREKKATKPTNMSDHRDRDPDPDRDHHHHHHHHADDDQEHDQEIIVEHDDGGNRGGAELKELEGQLIAYKFEMEGLLAQKASEVNEIEKRNQELQARIMELESQQHPTGDHEEEPPPSTTSQHDDIKDGDQEKFALRVEELISEVSSLQTEVASLRNTKKDVDLKLEEKVSQVAQIGENNMQLSSRVSELEQILEKKAYELDLVVRDKAELELQLDAKSTEMQTLREEEMARKSELVRKMDALSKLEEELRSQTRESTQARERMNARILELEQALSSREEHIGMLQNKIEDTNNEASNLKEQIAHLQHELESSFFQKERIVKEQQREDHVVKKATTGADQAEATTKSDSTTPLLLKPIRHLSMDSPKVVKPVESTKLSAQTLERKVEELAEQYQMRMENHIRLLRQRVKVAEQIHNETKDSYKQIKEELQNENKELQDKVVAFEDALKRMKETLIEPGGSLLTGLDVLIRKLDESKHPLNRMSRISDDIQVARNWMAGKKGEIKQLKDNMEDLTLQLSDKEGKVLELEARLTMTITLASEQEKEIAALDRKVKAVEQDLRGKEDMIMVFGEEKKEVIRQLCMLADYHRNRYAQLKRAVSLTPKPTPSSTHI